jgi:DNA-binding transcriptional regulator YiaG
MGERPSRVFLSFDHVVVDEAQAFSGEHVAAHRALVEGKWRGNRPQSAGETAVTGVTRALHARRSNRVRCDPVSTVTENADRAERIGRKIAEAREAKRLSKYMLAKLADVDEGQIRKWERGEHACSAVNLLKLIPHIGGTLDFYLGEDDDDDDDAA